MPRPRAAPLWNTLSLDVWRGRTSCTVCANFENRAAKHAELTPPRHLRWHTSNRPMRNGRDKQNHRRGLECRKCHTFGFPSGLSVKLGTIQRRLAWPLRKDDTRKSRSASIVYHCRGLEELLMDPELYEDTGGTGLEETTLLSRLASWRSNDEAGAPCGRPFRGHGKDRKESVRFGSGLFVR